MNPDPKYHIIILKDIVREVYLAVFANEHRVKLFKEYLHSAEYKEHYRHGKFRTFISLLRLLDVTSTHIVITDITEDKVYKGILIIQAGNNEAAPKFAYQCTVTEAMLVAFYFSMRFFANIQVMRQCSVAPDDVDINTGELLNAEIDIQTIYAEDAGFEYQIPRSFSLIGILLRLLRCKFL